MCKTGLRSLFSAATAVAVAAISLGALTAHVQASDDTVDVEIIRKADKAAVRLRVHRALLLYPHQISYRPVEGFTIGFEWQTLRPLADTQQRRGRQTRIHAFVRLSGDTSQAQGFSAITVWDVYDARSILSSGLIQSRHSTLFLLDRPAIEERKLTWFSPALAAADPHCVFARDFYIAAIPYANTGFDKLTIACGCSRRGLGPSDAELHERCYARATYRNRIQIAFPMDRIDLDRWHDHLKQVDSVVRPMIVER